MATQFKLEERTINVYFQKSQKFLYPLVGVGSKSYLPVQTYVSSENYSKDDCRLIAVFQPSKKEEEDGDQETNYEYFAEHFLKANRHFEDQLKIAKGKEVFIFNLENYAQDWLYFLEGKYSFFSEKTKRKILKFYANCKYSRQYMDSFLHPSEYFDSYAVLLDIDVSILEEVGELCDPVDLKKENIKLTARALAV